jgi:hypothetical protein
MWGTRITILKTRRTVVVSSPATADRCSSLLHPAMHKIRLQWRTSVEGRTPAPVRSIHDSAARPIPSAVPRVVAASEYHPPMMSVEISNLTSRDRNYAVWRVFEHFEVFLTRSLPKPS